MTQAASRQAASRQAASRQAAAGKAAAAGQERWLHTCPGLDPEAGARLAELLAAEAWMQRALDAVAASGLPDAWIGAGAVRDIVWGRQYGAFDPAAVKDVDVAYFDVGDLTKQRDLAAEETLARLADLPWEATNQAAVHTWYQQYFGGAAVEPFASVHEAVATWPETATCVAVRRGRGGVENGRIENGGIESGGIESSRIESGGIEICAPHGLADLLGGVWRVNPVRVTSEVSQARLARQRVRVWWPRVTVVPPG